MTFSNESVTFISLKRYYMTPNVTLHVDRSKSLISIVYGFEVDYTAAGPKDFNNNGTWGKIVNHGLPLLVVRYNPRRWKGDDSYIEMRAYADRQLEVFRSLQPKQLENYATDPIIGIK